MSAPTIGLVFTVYGNPRRLDLILRAFNGQKFFDNDFDLDEVLIVEDPSTDLAHASFERLAKDNYIPLYTMPEWGCMQGSAQAMMEQSKSDWIIYWPDDLLPTPGCVESAMEWCRLFSTPRFEKAHVGAFNVPYWNYEDLFPGKERYEMLASDDFEWLHSVPWNPHWYGPCYYVNVNGAAFALRREAWKAAGGFPKKTWCLDEHISCKMWLETDWTIASVPGPPAIHGGGMSTPDQHNNGRAHHRHSTLDGWYDEWGPPPGGSKEVLGERCREKMREAQKRGGLIAR